MFTLLLTLTASCPAVAPPPQAERVPARIGQIIVIGNELTRDDIILRCLSMFPGQILTAQNGTAATRRLAGLRLLGIRARWSVANPTADSAYKDILVTVEETWSTSLLLGPRCTMDDLVGRTISSVKDVGTACFSENHNLNVLVGTVCNLSEMVYGVAPIESLSTACGESVPLLCMVRLFIELPETLIGVAPILGASRE